MTNGVTCKKCGGTVRFPVSQQLYEVGICRACEMLPQYPAPSKSIYFPGEEAKADDPAPVIAGVGKDAPTVTNAAGGKQSHSPYRAGLLPPHALLAVAKVLAEGAAKYGERNWQKIGAADNLNHAMVHLLAIQAGDTSDEHLEHAATRILFALDQVLSGRDAKLQAATAEKGGAA